MLKYTSIFILGLMIFSCTPREKTSLSSSKSKGQELSEEDKMRLTSIFIDAQRERMLGNLYESDKLLKKCLEIDPDNHAVIYDRACIAQTQGFTDASTEMAEKAVSISPDNMWYQVLLAELYLSQNDLNKAAKTYERIIDDYTQGFDYLYDLSMINYRLEDLNGAIDALDRIQEKTGFSEELFQQKQLLYREAGMTDKSIKDLEMAIETNPKDPVYYGMLAELYESMGKTDLALEYYEKILEFDPSNGMVQLSLYEHYLSTDRPEKARQALIMGFEDELIDIDAKVGILLSYYEMSENDPQKREEALELCNKLVEVYPGEAKAHAIQGDFLLREERYAESRESFRNAVEMDPDKQIIWSQILTLDSQLQDYPSMARDSEEAIELFPTNASFYLLYGISQNQLGAHQKALEMLQAGREMVIDDDALLVDFYSSIGDACHQLGKHIESDKAYDKALRIAPDNIYVLNNYSYYLSLRADRLDKAEAMALKANELNPGSASFEDTYGWVLYKAGKYEKARTWIEKALVHGGASSGVIHEHYGDILFNLGDLDGAMTAWEAAKNLGDYSEYLEQKIQQRNLIE